MDLQTYIQSKRGNGMFLAEKLGIPLSYLSQMARGIRAITSERAVAIEYFSEGIASVEETLPTQQWVRTKDKNWPHPKGRPLSDVGADHRAALVESAQAESKAAGNPTELTPSTEQQAG